MSFTDALAAPATVTLYAIVRYDHAAGEHRLVGIQSTAVALLCSETGTGEWSVDNVDLALPPSLFQAARNTAAPGHVGSVSLNYDPSVHGSVNADPFVNNATAVVGIVVPGTTGDGSAEVHDLTVHLRALSGREILPLSGGGTVLLGSGSASASGRLAASALPNSTAVGTWPVWNDLFWRSTTAGASFVPADSTTSTEVGGSTGSVVLQLAADNATPAVNVLALFDGSATGSLIGSTKTFSCGDNDLEIVANSGGPTVTFNGLSTEVGVSPGVPKVIDFQILVEDVTFFSLEDVSISIEFSNRNAAGSTIATYAHAAGTLSETAAPPAGGAVTLRQPAFAATDRAPINHAHATWTGMGLYAAAEHSVRSATWGDGGGANFQISLDGRFDEIVVTVSATNHAGETTVETRTIFVSIPTDIVLSLDYSGSMLLNPLGTGLGAGPNSTRWDAAKGAANRLHAVFHAISPAIGGADALTNKTGAVLYWWNDATASDATAAVVNLIDVEDTAGGAPAPGTLIDDPAPAWEQYTPIANGILTAHGMLSAGTNAGWRRRVIVAMTDGIENRGPTIQDLRDDVVGPVPNVSADPENGIIIHSCTFGPGGTTAEDKMAGLADGSWGTGKSYGGIYRATSTADPTDIAVSKDLTDAFLDILTASIDSVNKLPHGDATSHTVTVDPGVARAVFLITRENAATLSGPSATSDPGTAAGGVRWWVIDNPGPGSYSVSVSGAVAGEVDFHCIVDLQLRASFEIVGSGALGAPLTLRARLTDEGRPVSGADVRVNVSGPGISEGELLERATKIAKKKMLVGKIPQTLKHPDQFLIRSTALAAAQAQFGLQAGHSRFTAQGIRLHEVPGRPGYYEGKFVGANEGSYTFQFLANGSLIEGGAFERAQSISRYMYPAPDPGLTQVEWIPEWSRKGIQRWTVVITPTSTFGTIVGPGREFSIRADGLKDPIRLVDRLDGSYAATLDLDALAQVPSVVLVGGGTQVELVPGRDSRRAKLVRVLLEQVRIKEAHESFGDPGEVSFDAVVATNQNRAGVVRQRIPERGVLELKEGRIATVKTLLFQGTVTEGTELLVQIGATEHDTFPSGDTKKDKLVTYRRIFRGPLATWAGSYSPDDEKRDPETLADWDVWYRIEVL